MWDSKGGNSSIFQPVMFESNCHGTLRKGGVRGNGVTGAFGNNLRKASSFER